MSTKLIHHKDYSGAEPAVVFVHGWTCDSSDWGNQLKWCQDTGRRAITLDLRGHGQSTDFQSDFSIVTMGSDVVEILQHLDVQSAIVVGHSLGTRVATEVALHAPDIVKGVALVDGSRSKTRGDPDEAAESCRAVMNQMGYAQSIKFFLGSMFLPGTDKNQKDSIINRACNLSPNVGIESIAMCVRWDVADFDRCYKQLDVPLQVIQSTHDVTPTERVPVTSDMDIDWHKEVKACGTNAEIELVTDCGHFTMLDAPDAVNAGIGRLMLRVERKS